MAYSVTIKRSTIKNIARLDTNTKERIAAALRELENNPRPRGTRKKK
jgi:mRNA-degrading endonuclease RelE of RelBE toxin-antitoxin system